MPDKRKVESELEHWTRVRQDAREKMREVYETIEKLKDLTHSYGLIYSRASNKFVEADKRVAELEGKVRRIPIGVSGKPAARKEVMLLDPKLMTKEMIEEMLKKLGKEI